jgi:hypothetical protein
MVMNPRPRGDAGAARFSPDRLASGADSLVQLAAEQLELSSRRNAG